MEIIPIKLINDQDAINVVFSNTPYVSGRGNALKARAALAKIVINNELMCNLLNDDFYRQYMAQLGQDISIDIPSESPVVDSLKEYLNRIIQGELVGVKDGKIDKQMVLDIVAFIEVINKPQLEELKRAWLFKIHALYDEIVLRPLYSNLSLPTRVLTFQIEKDSALLKTHDGKIVAKLSPPLSEAFKKALIYNSKYIEKQEDDFYKKLSETNTVEDLMLNSLLILNNYQIENSNSQLKVKNVGHDYYIIYINDNEGYTIKGKNYVAKSIIKFSSVTQFNWLAFCLDNILTQFEVAEKIAGNKILKFVGDKATFYAILNNRNIRIYNDKLIITVSMSNKTVKASGNNKKMEWDMTSSIWERIMVNDPKIIELMCIAIFMYFDEQRNHEV